MIVVGIFLSRSFRCRHFYLVPIIGMDSLAWRLVWNIGPSPDLIGPDRGGPFSAVWFGTSFIRRAIPSPLRGTCLKQFHRNLSGPVPGFSHKKGRGTKRAGIKRDTKHPLNPLNNKPPFHPRLFSSSPPPPNGEFPSFSFLLYSPSASTSSAPPPREGQTRIGPISLHSSGAARVEHLRYHFCWTTTDYLEPGDFVATVAPRASVPTQLPLGGGARARDI